MATLSEFADVRMSRFEDIAHDQLRSDRKKNADLAFQGKTKDGISVRVTAKCLDVEELQRRSLSS